MKARQLQVVAWGLSLLVVILAVVAWGQGYSWQLTDLSTYQLFPLFGLLAFSLMWGHYIMAASRQFLKVDKPVLNQYFEVTTVAVLVALLLHPGLLAWQLWRDGGGLPPGSYLNYVGSGLYLAVLAGLVAWLAFMAFEFRRKFGQRPWWRFVQYASDVGMFLIFVHALRLGGQLQSGWFRWVWYFYGVTLAISLFYMYGAKLSSSTANK